MIDLENTAKAIGDFNASTVEGNRVIVPTFSFYPSNSVIRAFVDAGIDSFVLSDGGGAVETLHGAGGYKLDYRRILGPIARRRFMKVTEAGWIVSPKVTEAGLTGAISEIVETSRHAAETLLRNFCTEDASDFRSAMAQDIDRIFQSVQKKAHIPGASNKPHTFDYLINLPRNRSLVIDAVVPDTSSVNAALVSHLDLKNAKRTDIRQAIVYDDSIEWKSSDLALLRIADPPIAFSHFDREIVRLVA